MRYWTVTIPWCVGDDEQGDYSEIVAAQSSQEAQRAVAELMLESANWLQEASEKERKAELEEWATCPYAVFVDTKMEADFLLKYSSDAALIAEIKRRNLGESL